VNTDRTRLLRLRRLEAVRTVARQTAAREAAEAQSTLAKLHALAERTGRLAGEYASRRDAGDGATLRDLGSFAEGLGTLSRNTSEDARRAEAVADAKLHLLGQAERRRAAVEERAVLQEKLIARAGEPTVLGSRKPAGTGLE